MAQFAEQQEKAKVLTVYKCYELQTTNWLFHLMQGREVSAYLEENELFFTIGSFRKTLQFLLDTQLDGIPQERNTELTFKIKLILAYLCNVHNIDLKDTWNDIEEPKYHNIPN
eukprot:CAMPEP_0116920616 /NCGR_PEP_ID=MMETSP0467-20121206/21135_1 /TAXON_ID=283647 /ORGANISM="Mesodinium pulex, Strain SPMC105" /LENGTH=112 /DNA_ID=CAMNT_0004598515 /DNA_START=556 /DNA_END=894 /DNA_ORIENTATION=+